MMAEFWNFDPTMEKKLVCHPDLPVFVCKWVYCKEKRTNQA